MGDFHQRFARPHNHPYLSLELTLAPPGSYDTKNAPLQHSPPSPPHVADHQENWLMNKYLEDQELDLALLMEEIDPVPYVPSSEMLIKILPHNLLSTFGPGRSPRCDPYHPFPQDRNGLSLELTLAPPGSYNTKNAPPQHSPSPPHVADRQENWWRNKYLEDQDFDQVLDHLMEEIDPVPYVPSSEMLIKELNLNKADIEWTMIKKLEKSDIGTGSRLLIPKEKAKTHISKHLNEQQRQMVDTKGLTLRTVDMDTEEVLNLRYTHWCRHTADQYVLNGDWIEMFVKRLTLKVGETVGLKLHQHGAEKLLLFSVLSRN